MPTVTLYVINPATAGNTEDRRTAPPTPGGAAMRTLANTAPSNRDKAWLSLLALAMGAFSIGTTEFSPWACCR
jgi:hypothetical protein